MSDIESRVTNLEKDVAVLDERTKHQGEIITEIKDSMKEIHAKIDAALKRPQWPVTIILTLLSSATVGLLVYAIGK